MKKLRVPVLLLLAAILLGICGPAALALDDPQIDCYGAVLIAVDGDNETVLYQKNAQDKVYPASLTKIMTVLLAVEAIENGTVHPEDPVTAQPGFDFDMIVGGTSVYLSTGEIMTLENLLYCAMVASGNDACNVIATYVGGSVSDFVAMMNARAAELGCTATHFTNPHGLPDENHYTTTWDFSRIVKEAARHDLFMQICSTVNYTVPATNMYAERNLSSTNSLINPNNPLYPGDYLYEYARGIKTGHTNDAGYCLASSAEKDGVRLLSVVMNGQAYEIDANNWYYAHFADTRILFDWAFGNFSYQEVVKSTEAVTEIPVLMGADADSVAIRPATSITAFLPNNADISEYTRTITLVSEEAMQAPVSAGQVVGEITVSKDGVVYGSAKLVTGTSIDLSRTQYMAGQIGETLRSPIVIMIFLALVLLFAGYIVLVVRYRAKRRAYQRRLADARQIRLEMEEDDEVHYVRRPAPGTARRRKSDIALEPKSVSEPTRQHAVIRPDEPTRTDLNIRPEPSEKAGEEYFEEFFKKK